MPNGICGKATISLHGIPRSTPSGWLMRSSPARSLQLENLPQRYRMMAELGDEAVREFSIYSFRVIFEIMPDHIAVLAVIHKRRDIGPEEIQ